MDRLDAFLDGDEPFESVFSDTSATGLTADDTTPSAPALPDLDAFLESDDPWPTAMAPQKERAIEALAKRENRPVGDPGIVGGIKDLVRGAARGAVSTVPEMAGKTLQFFDKGGTLSTLLQYPGMPGMMLGPALTGHLAGMRETPQEPGMVALAGMALERFGERMEEEHPWLKQSAREIVEREESAWSVRGAAGEAGEMAVPSLGPAAVGAGAGFVVAGPPGAAVGATIGFFSSLPLYFGAQAEETYRKGRDAAYDRLIRGEITRAQYDEDVATAYTAALATGGIEAGGELVADLVTLRLFRLMPDRMKAALVQEITKGIRPLGELVKDFGKVLVAEVGTEIGQSAGQMAVEHAAGFGEAPNWRDVSQVVLPTVILSLLTFGGAETIGGLRRRELGRVLADPEADPERRAEAIRTVYAEARRQDPALAEQWLEYAVPLYRDNKPIVSADFAAQDPAAPGEAVNILQPEKPATPDLELAPIDPPPATPPSPPVAPDWKLVEKHQPTPTGMRVIDPETGESMLASARDREIAELMREPPGASELDVLEAERARAKERDLDRLQRESKLPAALYDAERSRLGMAGPSTPGKTAMQLAFERAQRTAIDKAAHQAATSPDKSKKGPKGGALRAPVNRTVKFYTVETEDSGTLQGVRVMRHADGSVTIFDEHATMEYGAAFARDKSDKELLAYSYKPIGFRDAQEGASAMGPVPPSQPEPAPRQKAEQRRTAAPPERQPTAMETAAEGERQPPPTAPEGPGSSQGMAGPGEVVKMPASHSRAAAARADVEETSDLDARLDAIVDEAERIRDDDRATSEHLRAVAGTVFDEEKFTEAVIWAVENGRDDVVQAALERADRMARTAATAKPGLPEGHPRRRAAEEALAEHARKAQDFAGRMRRLVTLRQGERQPPPTAPEGPGSSQGMAGPGEVVKMPASHSRAAAARERYRRESAIDPTQDDLLAAIAKAGGYNRAEAEADGIDPAEFRRTGWKIKRVFTTGGQSADGLAETLAQYGYPVLNEQGDYDANVLLDAVDRALRGERIYSSQATQRQGEAMAMRAREDAEAQADLHAMDAAAGAAIERPLDEQGEPDWLLADEEYEGLETPEDQHLADVVAWAEAMGIQAEDIEDILERGAVQGLTNDEIKQQITERFPGAERLRATGTDEFQGAEGPQAEVPAERHQEEVDGEGAAISGADLADDLGGQPSGAQGGAAATDQPVPPAHGQSDEQPLLKQQTPEEVARQERERRQAEARQRREEAAAKAEAEQGPFVLTGSDREADQAAARGQQDIFGARPTPAQPQSTPTPSAVPQRMTYDKAVRANLQHMGTPAEEWSAVEVTGRAESDGRMMPVFNFPSGYKDAPTLFPGKGHCNLCATPIKIIYWIKNDARKWIMQVGSECVTHFNEGESGEDLAKRTVHEQNRQFVRDFVAARRALSRKYRHEVHIGYGRYRNEFKNTGEGQKAAVLWREMMDLLGPRITPDGQYPSSDGAITRWINKNKDRAEELLRDALLLVGEEPASQASKQGTEEISAAAAVPLAAATPHFETYEDAQAWINQKSKEYGSREKFSASDEYKAAYDQVQALYGKAKAASDAQAMQQLADAGLRIGDPVSTTITGSFLTTETLSGVITERNGRPYVKLDNDATIPVSRNGKVSYQKSVRWDPRWKKVQPDPITAAAEKMAAAADKLAAAAEKIAGAEQPAQAEQPPSPVTPQVEAAESGAADPLRELIDRFNADNPFAEKAARARLKYERLVQPTAREKAMGNAFPLGAGFGRRGDERRLDSRIDRAVEAEQARKDAEYLEAQARAFDAGEINAQGRHITKASQARSEKRQAAEERRRERQEAAMAQREGKERWQVPGSVWVDATGNFGGGARTMLLSEHREVVEQALKEGKSVPAEVLAEYPDLSATDAVPPAAAGFVAGHEAFIRRAYDGDITPEELKAAFARIRDNKDDVVAELRKRTKAELVKIIGRFSARMGDPKDRLVDMAYGSMLQDFALGRPISYMMGGKDAMEKALAALVEATTPEQISAYAAQVAERRAERQRRIEGVKNPQTLEDFDLFVQVRGEDALTPEQRTRYDELLAKAGRARREQAAESRTRVQAATEKVGAKIVETKHTQKGHDLFVVQLEKRVERDDYNRMNAAAKKLGGYYSSFARGGAVPGFQFRTRDAAEAFHKFVTEGDTAAATEAAAERREERQGEKKNAAAQRLAEMADRMEAAANEKLNADRLTNTARRARMADAVESQARADIAFAKTLRNLAAAIESGQATHLDGVRTKAQVETLDQLARRAQDDAIRAESDGTGRYYEENRGRPLQVSDIEHTKWPGFKTSKELLARTIKSLAGKPGTTLLANRLRKLADSARGDEDVDVPRALVERVVQKGGDIGPWWWADRLATLKRLEAAGIPDLPTLRAALREYVQFREAQASADPVKAAERALVGQKVGIDFFPTPKAVAERMVEEAAIEPGMQVLEPSAGNGNIAEAIRAAGAEPDVVELSHALRGVLEAKGFTLVGQDFMEVGGEYDRIVMNPPFSKNQDIEHVRHAYSLLKPGGRIVAIMGEGAFFRSDRVASEFREWLESVNGTSEPLPAGTFEDKTLLATTGANARLVIIDKLVQFSLSGSRTADAKTATTKAAVEAAIAPMRDAVHDSVGLTVRVIHSSEIPMDIRLFVPKGKIIKGFVHDWEGPAAVYLVHDALAGPGDAVVTFAHEIRGHVGVEAIIDQFGGWQQVMDAFQTLTVSKFRGKEFDSIRSEVYRRYRHLAEDDIQFLKEFIAVAAERRVKEGAVGRFMRMVRELFAKGLRAIGIRRPFSMTDIDLILSRSEEFLRTGETGAAPDVVQSEAAFSVATRADLGLTEPFDEGDYRPAVVAWAKRKWGEQTAPDGSLIWQNFTQWFGDSKVVDENGEPLVVYHGTNKDFDTFNPDAPRTALPLPGMFFTPHPEVAENYAMIGGREIRDDEGFIVGSEGGNVMPVYLSLQNPKTLRYFDRETGRMTNYKTVAEALQEAKQEGHDGAIIEGWSDGSGPIQYVAFRPEEIKSATGNRGTFDRNDPNTLHSVFSVATRADLGLTEPFDEGDYRPAVVAWAKRKWGEQTAPDGSLIWQNFTQWFGDSKVVDENGEPLVVYHGTRSSEPVQVFEAGRPTINSTTFGDVETTRAGIFFSDNRRFSEQYGDTVQEVYLKVENPADVDRGLQLDFADSLDPYDERDLWLRARNARDPWQLFDGVLGQRFSEFLKSKGYDGARFEESVVTDDEEYTSRTVVVFDSRQIKSATDNRGTFDPNNPNIRYSEAAPVYYSQLLEAVQNHPQRKATPGQWLAAFKKAGVKQEELDWLDVAGFMESRKIVERDELLEYVRANQVTVEETVLGAHPPKEREPLTDEQRAKANELQQKYQEKLRFYVGLIPEDSLLGRHLYPLVNERNEILRREHYEQLRVAATDHAEQIGERAFDPYDDAPQGKEEWLAARKVAEIADDAANVAQWELDGPHMGRYGELAIEQEDGEFFITDAGNGIGTIHKTYEAAVAEALDYARVENEGDGAATYSSYTLPGGENYRELLLRLPVPLREQSTPRVVKNAEDDYSIVDDTDHVYAEGLHEDEVRPALEEAQRGQRGGERVDVFRSAHYEEPNILAHVRFTERTDADGKRVLFIEEIQSDWHQRGRKSGYRERGAGAWDVFNTKTGETVASFDTDAEAREDAERRGPGFDYGGPDDKGARVPDAPFKKSWPMLAMRRMIRWAAENGFDRVAWTTGEQQAERYDLSKHVREIEWATGSDKDRKIVRIFPTRGNVIEVGVGEDGIVGGIERANRSGYDIDGKHISDVVGKGIGERILGEPHGHLTGLDLKIGGEGMRGFYDRILPREVGKYIKKWGAKVGATKIPQPPASALYPDKTSLQGEPATVHAFDVTDAMREAAMGGQPLFSLQSRRPTWRIDPDDDIATVVAKELAQEDEVFTYKISDAIGLPEIARDVGFKGTIIEKEAVYPKGRGDLAQRKDLTRRYWNIKLETGEDVRIDEARDGTISLNVADLEAGKSLGSRLYHIVANYAYNNGLVFVGDPHGITDTAILRRTENMLSSALKFGTTRHLRPHPKQMTESRRPMGWKEGDDAYNLRELIRTSYANTVDLVPEIKKIRYNFQKNQFEWIETGEAVEPERLRAVAEDANGVLESQARRTNYQSRTAPGQEGSPPESPKVGVKTLKRAILTHTLVRGEGPKSRSEWQGLLAGIRQQLHAGTSPLSEIQYSLEEAPAGPLQPDPRDPPYVQRLKVRMERELPTAPAAPAPQSTAPTPTQEAELFRHALRLLDPVRYQLQDKFIDLKHLEQDLGVTEAEDAYLAESVWQGRAGEALNAFEEERIQPLLAQAARTGLELAEIDRWLHARHAPEANAYLQEINPARDNNEALSGMSNDEAAAVLAEHRDNAALQELGRMVDRINAERVKLLVDEGLITQETANTWWATYRHYVPLKREEARELLPPRGQGFNIRGPESRRRTGSTRTVVHVLTNVIAQYEASVIRAEKNRVGRALLNFAMAHPDPRWWRIDPPKRMNVIKNVERGGVVAPEVVQTADPREYDNELKVKVDGEVHTITFNEANPVAMRIARAMKNLDQNDMGRLVRILMGVNRLLSALNTSWSPEFVISNFARDLQTAAYNLTATDLRDAELAVLKMVPAALNGLRQNIREGDKSSEWAAWAERFKRAGGKTGWIDHYRDIGEREHKLAKELARLKAGKGKHAFMRLKEFVEDYNAIVENGIRLAAFRKAVELGASDLKAAGIAKNLTVNFNRKGMAGPALNALYLFYNASIQGSTIMLQTLVKSKKGRRLAVATIALTAMLDVWNRATSGDDDDGENAYDALPDHVKSRYWIFMAPGGTEPLFKFMLPWGYNVLHVIGQQIGQLMTGDRFDPLESAGRIAAAIVEAFNPVGHATFLQTVAPTVADPLVQIGENKTWTGAPLKPEQLPFGPPKPEYQQHWSSVRGISKAIAKALNDWSGGDEIRPGWADVSPEWIDVFVDFFTGSAGRVVADAFNLAYDTVTGEPISPNEIPMVRRLYGYDNTHALQSRYFERSRDVAYVKKQIEELKGAERQKALRAPQRRLIFDLERAEKELRALRKERRELEGREASRERLERTEQRIRQAMARFNRRYAEVMYGAPRRAPQ